MSPALLVDPTVATRADQVADNRCSDPLEGEGASVRALNDLIVQLLVLEAGVGAVLMKHHADPGELKTIHARRVLVGD